MVHTHTHIRSYVNEFLDNTYLYFVKQIQQLYLKQKSLIPCLKVNHHNMNQV